jgi:hypothetical protein
LVNAKGLAKIEVLMLTLPISRRTSTRLILPSLQAFETPIAIIWTAMNDGAPNEIVSPYRDSNWVTNGFASGSS